MHIESKFAVCFVDVKVPGSMISVEIIHRFHSAHHKKIQVLAIIAEKILILTLINSKYVAYRAAQI